jgi:hypothetical protein
MKRRLLFPLLLGAIAETKNEKISVAMVMSYALAIHSMVACINYPEWRGW